MCWLLSRIFESEFIRHFSGSKEPMAGSKRKVRRYWDGRF